LHKNKPLKPFIRTHDMSATTGGFYRYFSPVSENMWEGEIFCLCFLIINEQTFRNHLLRTSASNPIRNHSRFQRLAQSWRNIVGLEMSNWPLKTIRDDLIAILLDLTLHMGRITAWRTFVPQSGRLCQLSFAGYPIPRRSDHQLFEKNAVPF